MLTLYMNSADICECSTVVWNAMLKWRSIQLVFWFGMCETAG